MYSNEATNSQSDVIWGAADIGREINAAPRKVYWLLESGLLPARKLGRQWVSTKSELRAWVRGRPLPAEEVA